MFAVFLHLFVAFNQFEKALFGVRSYEPGSLRLSNHANVEHFLMLYLQVFRQACHHNG